MRHARTTTPPSRGHHAPLIAVVAIACALGIMACGSSSPSSGATGPNGATRFIKFAGCMRAHGVPNFPDPSGGGGIHIQAGSGIDPQSPAFQAAQTACNKLLPGGGPGSQHPSEQAKLAMLQISDCMRRHGVSGFPDPIFTPPPTQRDTACSRIAAGSSWPSRARSTSPPQCSSRPRPPASSTDPKWGQLVLEASRGLRIDPVPVDSADDLYGLPLEDFIPERTALVKSLRSAKRREDAAQVAGSRKPSVAAWTVNQLVRTQVKTIQALFEAGDELAQAQASAAAGQRTADAMRDAAQRQRDALDGLLEAATGLLGSDGHAPSPATLERVADTLRAASIDEASRQQVAGGCLTQELHFSGLGIGDLPVSPPQSAPAKTTPAKPRSTRQKPKPETKPKPTAQHRAALKAARDSAAKARRAATRAEHELALAERRRDDALETLDEAQRVLATAKERATATGAELAEAERAVRDLADAS